MVGHRSASLVVCGCDMQLALFMLAFGEHRLRLPATSYPGLATAADCADVSRAASVVAYWAGRVVGMESGPARRGSDRLSDDRSWRVVPMSRVFRPALRVLVLLAIVLPAGIVPWRWTPSALAAPPNQVRPISAITPDDLLAALFNGHDVETFRRRLHAVV